MRHLCVIAAVCCCVAMLVAGCSGQKSEQFRREGDTLLKLGKLDDARGAYQRAQEMDPENAMAVLGLGRCLLAENNPTEALAEFHRAIALNPELEAGYMHAVRLLVYQKNHENAMELARTFQDINPKQGAFLVAFVFRAMDQPAEAVALLEPLAAEAPDNSQLQMELAAANLAAGNPAATETIARAVLEQDLAESMLTTIHLMLVNACSAQGKGEAIISEYQALTEAHPENMPMKLGLTQALLQMGQFDEAERVARALHEQAPESGWGNHVLGSCLLAQGKTVEALPYLEKAAMELPNQIDVIRKLAIARSGGRPADDRSAVTAQRQPDSPPLDALVLDGLPEDWQGLWKQAALNPLLAKRAEFLASGDANVAETLAMAAFFRQDEPLLKEMIAQLPAESPLIAYFDIIQKRDGQRFGEHMNAWTETEPDRVIIRANALGAGLAILGARFQGVSLLSETIAEMPDYGISYYNLAQILRAAGRPKVAAQILYRALPLTVNNQDIHSLLYTVLRESASLEEAQQAAEMTYSLFPEREESAINLAQACLDNQEWLLAEKVIRRAVGEHPDVMRLQLALARLLLHTGKPEEALEHLELIPDDASMQLDTGSTRVFTWAALKRWPEVIAATEPQADAPLSPAFSLLRAAAFVEQGQQDAARETYSAGQLATNRYYRVAAAALGIQEAQEGGETALATALAASPKALSAYFCALASLTTPSYLPAMTEMQAVDEAVGGHAMIAAVILQSGGHVMPAEEWQALADSTTERYPDSVEVWMSVARMQESLQQSQAQEKALDMALQAAPDSSEVWRYKALFLERKGDLPGAIAAYERLLALLPDDLMGNNNLAYCLLLDEGDLQKALACAERALAMQPNLPQTLHTLGLVQLRMGDMEGSARNLKLAVSLRPADPTLLLDYGQLLIQQDLAKEGLLYINSAVRYSELMDLAFPRMDEAKRILTAQQ